jgi:hypothetical protein
MGNPYEVYLMYSSGVDAYKIGVSKNSEKRLKQLQTGCPYQIELKSVFKTYRPFRVETALHNRYLQYKHNYDGDPISGEWFQLPITDVADFLTTCFEIEERLKFLVDSGNPFV